ncbi:MAG TPA: ferrochelatase [Acidimicrobiales bacterium]|nr:ferrochelatase [Acidimicrobiales bacterium]
MSAPVGVLVMSYGTPATAADIEAYYTDIRRGRPPSAEQLADLRRRYEAIGGLSPLAARTAAQAEGIQASLDAGHPGRFRVFRGDKHATPFIEDGVAAMAGAGVSAAVGVVLAPHYSALSVGEYLARAAEACAGAALAFHPVRSWHLAPSLIDALTARLRVALGRVVAAGVDPADVEVLVTAHSLPRRILETGDPYPEQVRQTGEAVARAAGVGRWRQAWQSAARTPEPWLGPDVTEVIRALPGEGARGVVVAPVGFTSDHLEILYDLDVDARRVAADAGLAFERTESLNDDPGLCAAVAAAVTGALEATAA